MRKGCDSSRAIHRAVFTTLETLEGRRLFSAGDLDAAFGGGDGIVTTDFPTTVAEVAQSATRLADGKLIVAGTSRGQATLARYDIGGALDTTFGTAGVVYLPGGKMSSASAVAEDPSSNDLIVAGGNALGKGAVIRLTAEGDVIGAFGANGVAAIPTVAGNNASGIAIDASGNIFVAATGSGDFAAVSFDASGALNTGFSGDGVALHDFGTGIDTAFTIANHDAGILLAGVATQPDSPTQGDTGQNAAFVKFDAAGDLDDGFDGDGVFVLDPLLHTSATIRAVRVLTSEGNAILAAGVDYENNFILTKLTGSGELDSGFAGGEGSNPTAFPGDTGDVPNSVDVDSLGRIVVTGNSGSRWAIARYDSNGIEDTSFTADGTFTTGSGVTPVAGFINADDSVLLAGSANGDNGNADFAQISVSDTAVAGSELTEDFSGSAVDSGYAVAQQSDGKLIVAGSTTTPAGDVVIGLVRYLPGGALDSSFGEEGYVTLSVTGFDEARAVTVDSTGLIYVGFTANIGSGGDHEFGVARFTTSGALDGDFGGGFGFVIDTVSGTHEDVGAIAIAPSGAIYLAGTSDANSGDFRVAKFSSSGVVLGSEAIDFNANSPDAFGGMAIQDLGGSERIVIAGNTNDGVQFDVVLVGLTSSLGLDPGFGTGGKVLTDFGGNELGSAVTVGAGNAIVVGGVLANTSEFETAIFKYSASGAIGSVGSVVVGEGMLPNAVAIAPSGKIVVAGTEFGGGGQRFGLARFEASGAPDGTFGTGGQTVLAIGSNEDAGGMLIQASDGNIVVAGRTDSIDFAIARFDGTGNIVVVAGTAFVTGTGSASEGVNYSINLSSSDLGTVTSWTIDWGDGHVDVIPGNPSSALHAYDDNGNYTISASATGTSGSATAPDHFVAVANVAPTASVTGPGSLQPGQTGTFTLTAADAPADQAANFTFKIDWDGNGTVDQTVVAASGTNVTHSFPTTGSFTVKVKATDKDAAESTSPGTKVVNVAAPGAVTALVQADPLHAGETMLLINGTNGANDIKLDTINQQTQVRVLVNGILIGTYSPTSRIVVYGNDGDDLVTHTGGFKRAVELYGGNGADTLKAGQDGDILVGGAGNDSLVAGQGNDLLIGGLGSDKLAAGGGEDILVAGFSSFDDNPAALNMISDEWNSTRSFNSRIANLVGNNPNAAEFAARLNGNIFFLADVPNATVFDDGNKDTANGAGGSDWFFVNVTGGIIDKTNGAGNGAVVTDIS